MRVPTARRLVAAAILTVLGAGGFARRLPAQPQPQPAPSAEAGTPPAGRLVFDSVASAALRDNRVGDRGVRSVLVYLPPGYDRRPAARYPSVYLLHGGRMPDSAWVGLSGTGDYYHDWPDSTRPLSVARLLDRLVAAGAVRPMIVVMPDARDRYDGSWYANSPATGRWDDYLAGELVRHVDRTYRTIPRRESRGVAGHSLGGYGALKLAARHADVFGAVYGLSPCCLAFTDEFALDAPSWRETFALAERGDPRLFQRDRGPLNWGHYTAALAFSPDAAAGPLGVAWPVALRDGRLALVPGVARRWQAEAPANLARPRAAALRRLRGIGLENGTREPLENIARSARLFADSLAAAGVPYTYHQFDGGHEDRIAERLRLGLFPFFSARLAR